mmetsp:Transcript_28889/g.73751  ORF Transcript_28889/g.73751 Transcript_28889/m.73751 type:complete len:225 (-) Transcript_28889:304-978(-)
MMMGVMLPSSAVTCLGLVGSPVAGAVAAPHTMWLNVVALPVRCMEVMSGWRVTYSPTSFPPYTSSTQPRSTSGASTFSSTGPAYSLTGDILTRTTSSSTISLCSTSSTTTLIWLPAPSTRDTAPPLLACFPAAFARYSAACEAGLPASIHTSPLYPGNSAPSMPRGNTSATTCPVGAVVVLMGGRTPPLSSAEANSWRANAMGMMVDASSPKPPPHEPLLTVPT